MATHPPTRTLDPDLATLAPPRYPPAAPKPARPTVVAAHTAPTLAPRGLTNPPARSGRSAPTANASADASAARVGLGRFSFLPLPPSRLISDTSMSYYFHSNLTGLAHPDRHRVPMHVDERFFFTLGLGSICRGSNKTCQRRRSPETIVVATMNNVSFRHPINTSLLERYYDGRTSGLYTEDLPDHPPHPYNYTDRALIPPGPLEEALEPTFKATKLRRFRYNTSVEIIFQSTALLQSDSNPMHLHGYDFFVLATGIGNYNPKTDPKKFNYHNPQLRNTVQVPRTGWAAVRFVTDNPGMWYLHCHFEFHIIMGMATAFIVENGPTPETSLPPPPPEFKRCGANGLTKP